MHEIDYIAYRYIFLIAYSSREAIAHGKAHEDEALDDLGAEQRIDIDGVGLEIDVFNPFLAGTPDGRTVVDGKVTNIEVKCPFQLRSGRGGITLEEALEKPTFELERVGDIIRLKRTSNWYTQIQTCMAVTHGDITQCLFYVWAPNISDRHTELIKFDPDFWAVTFPKLQAFYHEHLLKELADSRVERGLEPRDSREDRRGGAGGTVAANANVDGETTAPNSLLPCGWCEELFRGPRGVTAHERSCKTKKQVENNDENRVVINPNVDADSDSDASVDIGFLEL